MKGGTGGAGLRIALIMVESSSDSGRWFCIDVVSSAENMTGL